MRSLNAVSARTRTFLTQQRTDGRYVILTQLNDGAATDNNIQDKDAEADANDADEEEAEDVDDAESDDIDSDDADTSARASNTSVRADAAVTPAVIVVGGLGCCIGRALSVSSSLSLRYVTLSDARAAAFHCQIGADEKRFVIAANANAVAIARATNTMTLIRERTILIGAHDVTLFVANVTADALTVVVRYAHTSRRRSLKTAAIAQSDDDTFTVGVDGAIIGRTPECTIRIRADSGGGGGDADRAMAAITYDKESALFCIAALPSSAERKDFGLWIRLSAAAAAAVDGVSPLLLTESASVSAVDDGDRIRIGNTEFAVSLARVPALPTPSTALAFAAECNFAFNTEMQDRIVIVTNFAGDARNTFLGVFDGHIERTVADFVAAALHQNVADAIAREQSAGVASVDVSACLQSAYDTTAKQVRGLGESALFSGATAVSVVVWYDQATRTRKLFSANIGDSHAYLRRAGKLSVLSYAHVARDVSEADRIRRFGGRIAANHRLGGCLDVTRAFGDLSMAHFGLTAQAHLTQRQLTEDDTHILLCSDGLDVLALDRINEIMDKHAHSAHDIAKRLVAEALRLKSKDNVSVAVMLLADSISISRSGSDLVNGHAGVSASKSPLPVRTSLTHSVSFPPV